MVSFVDSHGEVALDLGDKIDRASKAFVGLKKSAFWDNSLSIQAKKMIYPIVAMGVLLYAAETWFAKQKDIRRLEVLSPSLPAKYFGKQQSTAECPAHQQ